MVHLIKKEIGNHKYLYLQKSIRINGKVYTKHIAYLGKADKYTKNDLARILSIANNSTKKALNKILGKYKKNAG